ncbi:substrate-binding domain-containing protein [Streptomyces sp. NPDC050161]|uniref:substrate-binding domain-containing protein n=1 Tax=Streptomyces sp. NPDC050161 TaxID=3365604 RepID=UPI0037B469BA
MLWRPPFPDDLLLVCASEDPALAVADPSVSTVSLVPRHTAAITIAALVDLAERPDRSPAPTVVPARLDIRASSTRPAV